jgi:NADH-quinone oxidoreductase subunit N
LTGLPHEQATAHKTEHYKYMGAIIAAIVFGVVMMFAGFMADNKKTVSGLAVVLFLALGCVNLWDFQNIPPNGASQFLWNDMLKIDRYSLWFNTLIAFCSLMYVLLMNKEIQKAGQQVAEYFALILFILSGVFILSTYNNLLMLFIGIEIISIPQYILAGSDKHNLKSSEAALKYFLMGAFSTCILLMGITLLYGAVHSFNMSGMPDVLQNPALSPLAIVGILFIMIAFSFKVSAAPMHIWTPDVYDGAPTPFTAFMATVAKVAAFFAFLRLFQTSFNGLSAQWTFVLACITAATLFIGNLSAVFQQSVKRMLAYSSIAQAGFMLFAVLAVNAIAWQGIIIYSVAYTIATVGFFTVLVKLKDNTFDGFNGLAEREPFLAFIATVFLLSLAGIPLTGGFMAKYFVVYAVVQQGKFMWLVIFALLMAAVSVYYYFKVIIAMYFKKGTPELTSTITITDKLLLALNGIIIVLLGLFPQLFLNAQ